MESTSAEFLQDYVSARSENNAVQFMVSLLLLASHAQNKLSTLVGQDLGMKTIVDKMKSTGDLYIDVIENVHCVLDCNVPLSLSLLPASRKSPTAPSKAPSRCGTLWRATLASTFV